MILYKAIETAALWHEGQVDKAGEPYVLHPLRVMLAVPERSRVVALLHDVIEDTRCPLEFLQTGLGAVGWEALMLVTRPHAADDRELLRGWRTTYAEFVARIAAAPGEAGAIAREVKVADIRDNLSPARVHADAPSLRPRYLRALDVLGATP